MVIYFIIFLLLIGMLVGLVLWIIRLSQLYKRGKKQLFFIEASILIILLILSTWKLQLFPLSKNFYIQDRTTQLTGKKFWSWEEFEFEEISVRGEGYTMDIYKFSQEMGEYFKNPDNEFFSSFPTEEFANIRWTRTPVKENDKEILEFVTPNYTGWKGDVIDQQELIRQIANQPGAYYSYLVEGGTDFYLIVPDKRLVILINHNM